MTKTRLLSIPAALAAHRWSCALAALAPGLALANPSGADVVAGQVGLVAGTNSLVVNQASQDAVINWQQFSIGSQEFVVFNQPSASATVLNRVIGGTPSEILGSLAANGRVFLINPQGVLFGQGAQVDVGSLVASTLDIADADFLAGEFQLRQGTAAPGSVTNLGQLRAADGGFVVLAGDAVHNAGVVNGRLGDVVLASGSELTLQLDDQGLVGFSIDRAAISDAAGVENIGVLVADGGVVVMSAEVARSLVGNAVNNSGRVSARSLDEREGQIYLSAVGGDINHAGVLDASALDGADGGQIRMTSDRSISVAGGSQTLATGASGGDVRVVAEQLMSYERGARIDVGAQSLLGRGGFVELSGHRGVRIGDIVSVGRGGHFLIDPFDFVVDDDGCLSSQSCSIEESTLESQLRNGGAGSLVDIVASDGIQIADLVGDGANPADNLIDGTNASPSLGAGLRMRIGFQSASFFAGSNGEIEFADLTDGIKVDGDLILEAGTITGHVIGGGLQSLEGGVRIAAPQLVQVDGTIRAAGLAEIDAGTVEVQDIVAGSVDVQAPGAIEVGTVTAQGDVTLDGTGSGALNFTHINGGLAGLGFITLSRSTGNILGGNLSTTHGDIQVDAFEGNIDVGNVSLINAPGLDGHTIRLTADGDLVAGALSATAPPGGGNASLLIDASSASGLINIGSVTMNAEVTTGANTAPVQTQLLITADNGPITVGDVNLTTRLGTGATGQGALALISIAGTGGAIQTGQLNATATVGSAADVLSSISVSATNASITVDGANAQALASGSVAGNVDASAFLVANGTGAAVTVDDGVVESIENDSVVATATAQASDLVQANVTLTSGLTGAVNVSGNLGSVARAQSGRDADAQIFVSTGTGDLNVDGALSAAADVIANSGTGGTAFSDVFVSIGTAGILSLGDIAAQTVGNSGGDGTAQVFIVNSNGNLTTGDIDATSNVGFATADVFQPGSGVIVVNGGINVAGGRVSRTSGEGGTALSAFLNVDGNDIFIQGPVSVSGIGDATALLFTNLGTGDVAVDGAISVTSTAVTDTFSGQNGTELRRNGVAALRIAGSSTSDIRTSGITLSGPNVGVSLDAGRVILGNAGTTGVSLSATALPGGEGAGDGAFYRASNGTTTLVTSTFGLASVEILAGGGSVSDPSVVTDGSILVTGPAALLDIESAFGVVIGNFEGTSPANLDVSATGYVVDGNFSALTEQHAPNSFLSSAPFTAPALQTGRLEWGDAALAISGAFTGTQVKESGLPAGNVLVFGDILVNGQGGAHAQVNAASLDMDGVGGTPGDIDVTASLGLIEGTSQTSAFIGQSLYTITRVISDGAGGPARWGSASFGLQSLGTAELGDLRVSGGRALADLAASTITIGGDAMLRGGRGTGAPVYHEVATFAGTPPLPSSTTHIVGDLSLFTVDADALNVAGAFQVSGTGAAVGVLSAPVLNFGSLLLDAAQGQYSSNYPGRPASIGTFGDTALIFPSTTDITGGDVVFSAAGTAHVGGGFDLNGDFAVRFGATGETGAIDQILPGNLVVFLHPLVSGFVPTSQPDIPLAPLQVTAQDIELSFRNASTLLNADLDATGALTVFGTGAQLNAGAVDWNAASMSVQNVVLATSALNLNTSGALGITAGARLLYSSGLINAGGALTVAGSTLAGNAHDLRAGGTLALSGTDISAAGGNPAGSITTSSGGNTTIANTRFSANTITITSGGTVGVTNGDFGNNPIFSKAPTDADITVTAVGAISLDAASSIDGDQVRLDSSTGNVTIGGNVSATHLVLEAGNQVNAAATGATTVIVDALDVTGRTILLDNASITVGSGLATSGADSTLLAGAGALAPASARPNAAFIATDGISVGALHIEGGYLFTRAPIFGFNNLTTGTGGLFWNLRPFLNTADQPVATIAALQGLPNSTTFALGGTGFSGTIIGGASAKQPLTIASNANLVFLTAGNIVNKEFIVTTGEVLVLAGNPVTTEVPVFDDPNTTAPVIAPPIIIGGNGAPPLRSIGDDDGEDTGDPLFGETGGGENFISGSDSPDGECT